DFGLARGQGLEDLTAEGGVVGTLRYMPPERLRGTTDASGDVYGLGLVLYELLTLRPAFDAESPSQLLGQGAHGDPPAPPRRAPGGRRPGWRPARRGTWRRSS